MTSAKTKRQRRGHCPGDKTLNRAKAPTWRKAIKTEWEMLHTFGGSINRKFWASKHGENEQAN